MDLKEKTTDNQSRHPWETTRFEAFLRILAPLLQERIAVLDVGCGDGYVSTRLNQRLRHWKITGVDTGLTNDDIAGLATTASDITFTRSLPTDQQFDLILLLDVIEHVQDDQAFLGDLADHHLGLQGRVLISAPAFQSLYSKHDEFLGHYRRYSLNQLVQLTRACGLQVDGCGYLFFSLLLPKLFLFKIFNNASYSDGVGNWRRGRILTSIIEAALRVDNFLLFSASRLGIKIPGLTGWVLCQKPQ